MEYNPAIQENHIYENKNLIGQINCSGIDKFRNIYFSTDQSDFGYFNLQNKQFEKPTFLSNEMKFIGINDIVYDQFADALILSSYGQGIFVYDYSSNTVSQFKKNAPSLSLSASYPISLFSDSKGIIMSKILACLSLCFILTACGSSNNEVKTEPVKPPEPLALDVGTQVEVALAKPEASSDTAEPESIELVTVPVNDDSEPKAI